MSQFANAGRILAPLVMAGLGAACDQAASTAPTDHSRHTAVVVTTPSAAVGSELVKEVHALSARFHSTEQAAKAGYVVDPFCVAVPNVGGMGHHWSNPTLVDPVFDATQPEVMLYAPDKHGKLKLVAIEYIVINVGQPVPTFDGHPFDVGGTPVQAPHWSLHVWLHKPNPSGLHAPFNPDVTCN